jgi:ketosteroid isomerase-like protein
MLSDTADARQLVQRYFALLNGSDLSTAHEVLSDEVVFVGPRAPEGIHGRQAFKEFLLSLRHDSPDLRFEEIESLVEGSRVASVFTMTRTTTASNARRK